MIYTIMYLLYLPYLPFIPVAMMINVLGFFFGYDPIMFGIISSGIVGSIGVWRFAK